MKKIYLLIMMMVCLGFSGGAGASDLINGAGATFPYPLYSKWAYEYAKNTGVKLNYQSIGSGGGIKQIQARTVDFGASDAPLSPQDLEASGLIQFPMAIGGVVPVVNIKGVKAGEIKLTGKVLADIYLGRITKWDDPAIKELNPGLEKLSGKITVVHRSDGSGTTWIFTSYLDKASSAWSKEIGFGKAVKWSAGVGGKGNEGVATYVKRIKNSIGYVEYAYALQNKLTHVKLKNRDGNFVEPSIDTFMAAAEGADWEGTPGYSVVLTDQPGKDAWPISGATFILVPERPENCTNIRKVFEFFDWAYRNGAEMARSLDYVPIPEKVYTLMEQGWSGKVSCNGKPAWGK